MIIPSGGIIRFPELVFVWAVFACVSMPRITNSAIASCALIRPGLTIIFRLRQGDHTSRIVDSSPTI